MNGILKAGIGIGLGIALFYFNAEASSLKYQKMKENKVFLFSSNR